MCCSPFLFSFSILFGFFCRSPPLQRPVRRRVVGGRGGRRRRGQRRQRRRSLGGEYRMSDKTSTTFFSPRVFVVFKTRNVYAQTAELFGFREVGVLNAFRHTNVCPCSPGLGEDWNKAKVMFWCPRVRCLSGGKFISSVTSKVWLDPILRRSTSFGLALEPNFHPQHQRSQGHRPSCFLLFWSQV